MPLGHLIALIINAHPARQRSRSSVHANGSIGRTLNRKTSLLRIVPTACGQAADESIDKGPRYAGDFRSPGNAVADARRLRIDRDVVSRSMLGAILPLHDVRYRACRIKPGGSMTVAHDVLLRTSLKLGWWSQTESNRRPPACKAGALPTELWPLQISGIRSQHSGRACTPIPIPDPGKWWAWEDLNFRPHAYQARALTN
jgi:hypothetical protein